MNTTPETRAILALLTKMDMRAEGVSPRYALWMQRILFSPIAILIGLPVAWLIFWPLYHAIPSWRLRWSVVWGDVWKPIIYIYSPQWTAAYIQYLREAAIRPQWWDKR